MSTRLYLASRSPRRRKLLGQLGVEFLVVDPAVAETRAAAESPEAYVQRMAWEKARSGFEAIDDVSAVALGADTIVSVDGAVLGKPRDEAECRDHLERLSGRSHLVLSAVALSREPRNVRVSASTVWFRDLSRSECSAYWETGEPRDKAGGYGIQGLAAAFIRRLDGSYSGVMGLPLFETAELLSEAGIFSLRTLRPAIRRGWVGRGAHSGIATIGDGHGWLLRFGSSHGVGSAVRGVSTTVVC